MELYGSCYNGVGISEMEQCINIGNIVISGTDVRGCAGGIVGGIGGTQLSNCLNIGNILWNGNNAQYLDIRWNHRKYILKNKGCISSKLYKYRKY